jgi:succinate-semialdehyde dehydrogenase/glutarate-semialdehyde dehydrogenase
MLQALLARGRHSVIIGKRLKSGASSLPLLKNQQLWKLSGYVGGKWTDGTARSRFQVINPSNGEVIAELPRMTAADAKEAAKISVDGWKKWSNTLAGERSKVLRNMAQLMSKFRDDLGYIICKEAGKPMSQSLAEIDYARSFLLEYAEEAKRVSGTVMEKPLHGRRMLTIKQAVGPAALITPWNFPSASMSTE